MRFSSGSKLGTIHMPTCQRFSYGMSPQLSSPGSPGFGIVRVRHSSLPVFASNAVMTQASGPPSGSQLRPERQFDRGMAVGAGGRDLGADRRETGVGRTEIGMLGVHQADELLGLGQVDGGVTVPHRRRCIAVSGDVHGEL